MIEVGCEGRGRTRKSEEDRDKYRGWEVRNTAYHVVVQMHISSPREGMNDRTKRGKERHEEIERGKDK